MATSPPYWYGDDMSTIEENNRKWLIHLCEKAIVNHENWANRDSANAQAQVGRLWAYLSAGLPFRILTKQNCQNGLYVTNDRIIWIEVEVPGFAYFEGGEKDADTFYLPKPQQIVPGHDWY